MARVSLASKASIARSIWSPTKPKVSHVYHYSIPNYDGGSPQLEDVKSIKSSKFLLTEPCVLISKLNPGDSRVWLLDKIPIGVGVCSTEFVVLIPHDLEDLDYLYFQLKAPSFQNRLVELATGTSNSHQRVRPEEILNQEVDWLDHSDSRTRSTSFLIDLEKKIALNGEISESIETISQTIFKSWFTDFDPVHAKARGEQPDGMDAETAALFPDSFEESEAGLIPAGWHLSDVGSTLRVLGGSTPSTSQPEYWDGLHQWTTPKDMSALSGLISLSSSRRLTDEGLAKITSGLLDKDSILMSSRAPIGYVAIADSPTAVNQGIIAISPTDCFHPLYLANWVKAAMPEIESRAGGSSFPEIGKASFRTLPFLIPTKTVLKAFWEVAEPMLGQLKMLAHQNRTLKGIRDTLLPRLISGELEIPEELLVD